METFIYLDNYRGFSDAYIPLRQVNFLVGENSTGKSSLLELLEVFSNPGFWIFEPKLGASGTLQARHFLDLVSASSKSKTAFTIGLFMVSKSVPELDGGGMLITYTKGTNGRPIHSKVSVLTGDVLRTVIGKPKLFRKGEIFRFRRKVLRSHVDYDQFDKARLIAGAHKSNAGFENGEVDEDYGRAPYFMVFGNALYENNESDEGGGITRRVPAPFGSKFVELAPIRSRPRRTYDAPQTEFSPEGDHIPYMIKKRLSSKVKADDFKAFLERTGKDSGLFKSIDVKSYGQSPLAPFEMKVILGKAKLGLDNLGYGVSQSLPILVEMFVRPKRTAFTIQQPEVHLHPKAQATIGDIIAELARLEDKSFFVETHSDFTIDRFRLNIRRGGHVPAQLLFFERAENGNMVTALEIDELGNLPDTQPENYRAFFFNESLSLLE